MEASHVLVLLGYTLMVVCIEGGWLNWQFTSDIDKCKAELSVLQKNIETQTSECDASKDYLKKQLQSMTLELKEFNTLKRENRKLNERLSQMENALKEAQDKNKRTESSRKELEGEVVGLKKTQHTETSSRQAALEKDLRVLKRQNRECVYYNERLKTVLEKERICGDKVIDLEAAVTAGDSRRKSEEKRTFELELQVINLKTSLKLAEQNSGQSEKAKTSLYECLMNCTRLTQRLDDVTRECVEVLSNGHCLTATDPNHTFVTVTTVCAVLSLCLFIIIISLRRCYNAVRDGCVRILNLARKLIPAKYHQGYKTNYDRRSIF